jgi:hypothetical protein
MADKDFKVKNGIDVAGNAIIGGNLNAAKYQDSAPSSPVNGQIWIDSNANTSVLNTNDFLLKADASASSGYLLKTDAASTYATIANGYRFNQRIIYETPGTFTFSKSSYPWLRAIKVCVQGAGGGGGGAKPTTGNQQSVGDGGGGGAYGEAFITDIAGLASSVTVTVGAGGTAGTTSANGGAGGSSSFGTYSAGGGGGGTTYNATGANFVIQYGGTGSNVSSNLVNVIPGSYGQAAICVSFTALTFQGGSKGGDGGASFLGAGGVAGNAAAGGVSAGIRGGGGGARNAGADNPSSGGNGAAGGAGVVMLELYS